VSEPGKQLARATENPRAGKASNHIDDVLRQGCGCHASAESDYPVPEWAVPRHKCHKCGSAVEIRAARLPLPVMPIMAAVRHWAGHARRSCFFFSFGASANAFRGHFFAGPVSWFSADARKANDRNPPAPLQARTSPLTAPANCPLPSALPRLEWVRGSSSQTYRPRPIACRRSSQRIRTRWRKKPGKLSKPPGLPPPRGRGRSNGSTHAGAGAPTETMKTRVNKNRIAVAQCGRRSRRASGPPTTRGVLRFCVAHFSGSQLRLFSRPRKKRPHRKASAHRRLPLLSTSPTGPQAFSGPVSRLGCL